MSRLLYESDILTQAGAPYHADFRNLRLGKFLLTPTPINASGKILFFVVKIKCITVSVVCTGTDYKISLTYVLAGHALGKFFYPIRNKSNQLFLYLNI